MTEHQKSKMREALEHAKKMIEAFEGVFAEERDITDPQCFGLTRDEVALVLEALRRQGPIAAMKKIREFGGRVAATGPHYAPDGTEARIGLKEAKNWVDAHDEPYPGLHLTPTEIARLDSLIREDRWIVAVKELRTLKSLGLIDAKESIQTRKMRLGVI